MRRQSKSVFILRTIFFGILLGSGLILAIVGIAARSQAADGVFAVIFFVAGALLVGYSLYMLRDIKYSANMQKNTYTAHRETKFSRSIQQEAYESLSFGDFSEPVKPEIEFSDTLVGMNTVKAEDMRRFSEAGIDDIDLMLMPGEKLRQTFEECRIDTSEYNFDF